MKKIFKWFYKPKQKGEDKMSKKIEEQIRKLTERISQMSDKMAIVERDVERFKKQVSSDMKRVVEIARDK